MVAKKNAKRKQTKAKSTASKKITPARKKTNKKKLVAKKATSAKKLSKRKKPKAAAAKKATRAPGTKVRKRSQATQPSFLRMKDRSGLQSGDLQGLSGRASADSESIGELLEEGNAFEADAVKGVEDAGRDATREVRTHEVPEDDVPVEYLDSEEE